MAEFCKACSIELFGLDASPGDFAGISSEEDTKNGTYAVVLCEGCGVNNGPGTLVDHTGLCVAKCDAFLKGKPGHGGVPLPEGIEPNIKASRSEIFQAAMISAIKNSDGK